MITPRQARVSETCVCIGTLGRLELEAVAACIVLYHWEHSPDEWIPITRRQIADWIPSSAHLSKVMSNPFWTIDITGFCNEGFIEGWDVQGPEGADLPGTLTPKFFEALARQRVPPEPTFTEVETHPEGMTIDFENMGGSEVPCDAEK